MMVRAGGHVLRGGRWVAEAARPAAGPAPAVEPPAEEWDNAPAPGETWSDGSPVDEAEPTPDRANCPDCGKDVAVKRDGSLRKHACEGGA